MDEPTQDDLAEFANWRQAQEQEEYQLWLAAFEQANAGEM